MVPRNADATVVDFILFSSDKSFLAKRGPESCGGFRKVNNVSLGLTLININPGPNPGIN
jgi:hypothetical protein